MTNLCINNIDTISLSNISIKEYDSVYKIYYKLNDIIINGILFKFNGKLKEMNDKYRIYSNDTNNSKLKLIDQFFSKKINNYKSFLLNSNENENIYIEIKKNPIIDSIFNKYKNKNFFYLNIKFINKYNNTPTIYII